MPGGFPAGLAPHAQTETDVLGYVHEREQQRLLEHHHGIPFFRGHPPYRMTVDQDISPGRLQQSGDGFEDGGLAGPAGTQQRHHLPIVHLQVEPLDHRPGAIIDGQVFKA